MKTTINLSKFKVYEFYFINSDKTHFAIAKSKKDVKEYYRCKKVYLRNDIAIDESMSFADVITGERTANYMNCANNLEFYIDEENNF